MGPNPAGVETIFRPLVRLARTRRGPGLSIKWTGRRLVTDSGINCAWVIQESKTVQIHVDNNRRCLCVPHITKTCLFKYTENFTSKN